MSYKKLIEEYAETFFSDTVTCNMDEDINKLENRSKRDMKGDIYKTKYKARRIEKKLAAEKKKAGQAENEEVNKNKDAKEEKKVAAAAPAPGPPKQPVESVCHSA